MEECELCGRKIDKVYVIDIEGAELGVCSKCAKGQKILRVNTKLATPKPKYKTMKVDVEEQELVENYGKLIKNAREKLNLPLPVLAEILNEKESHLLRVEQQKTMPSIELTKKLEKFLNIRLVEEKTLEKETPIKGKTEKASIGDFIKKP